MIWHLWRLSGAAYLHSSTRLGAGQFRYTQANGSCTCLNCGLLMCTVVEILLWTASTRNLSCNAESFLMFLVV